MHTHPIDDVIFVYIQTALCWQNTVYVMFRRAKIRVVMVRLHTLSSWLPKHKGFARRYAREPCYGFRVMSEVTSSIWSTIRTWNRHYVQSKIIADSVLWFGLNCEPEINIFKKVKNNNCFRLQNYLFNSVILKVAVNHIFNNKAIKIFFVQEIFSLFFF